MTVIHYYHDVLHFLVFNLKKTLFFLQETDYLIIDLLCTVTHTLN